MFREICNRGLTSQIDLILRVLKCERAKTIVRISQQLAPCPQWLREYLIRSAY